MSTLTLFLLFITAVSTITTIVLRKHANDLETLLGETHIQKFESFPTFYILLIATMAMGLGVAAYYIVHFKRAALATEARTQRDADEYEDLIGLMKENQELELSMVKDNLCWREKMNLANVRMAL